MCNAAKDRLDRKIQAVERKLEQLKIVRSALDDAELAAEMQEVFSAPEQVEGPVEAKPLSANMQKLVAFFQARDNRPADLFEMEEQTGISRNSIRQMVYQSNMDCFEREGHRGGGQRSSFWLKADIWARNGRAEQHPGTLLRSKLLSPR